MKNLIVDMWAGPVGVAYSYMII